MELTAKEQQILDGYYVRVRYNDRPVTIPGCKAPGNHLDGDKSFCTLVSDSSLVTSTSTHNPCQETFKRIADKFTPKNWKKACESNLDEPAFSAEKETAGY